MVSVSAFSSVVNFISQLSSFIIRKGLVHLCGEVCEGGGTGLEPAASARVCAGGETEFGREVRLCFRSYFSFL